MSSRDKGSAQGNFREIISSAASASEVSEMFRSGAIVLVSLQNPREKFWGALISLAPAGLVLSGIPLESFEDFAAQIRDGESTSASTLFFPMHRVERIELDQRSGDITSLSERFKAKSGLSAEQVFTMEKAL